ncbi:aminoglycoside N(3)-acetyltransferase [Streptomyces sp. NPDC002187]|uniref:aminoglycoside N(3)-acetyltransferase n=1 Tax=Streptomyces sp. NPDC002187 TaxID=3364637 RepID=UPI0036B79C64
MADPRQDRNLADGVREAGVRSGMTLLVHASLHGTGLRAAAVRDALLDVLGPGGTLVVPAFTAENSDTSPAYRARVRGMTPQQEAAFRADMPAFHADTTPSQGMGRLAESVRTAEGAVRSGHPQTSFAAIGHRSAELLADHPLTCHLGERSPLGALYRADAQVLMINTGYRVCTAFHLAEYRTQVPLRTYRCVVPRPGGGREWTEYKDIELDDSDFGVIGSAFSDGLKQERQLGGAVTRLFSIRDAVDHAERWMTEKRR